MSWYRPASVCVVALLGLVLTRSVGVPPRTPAPADRDHPPRHATLPVVSPSALPKWTAAIRREAAAQGARGLPCAPDCLPAQWRAIRAPTEGFDPAVLIVEVNREVNRTPYRPDRAAWGEDDFWAAPGEFLARGGDCEDYAIAKYYALKALGLPAEAMRIVVLNDRRRKLSHAVLAVRWAGRDVVLDNRESRPLSWSEVPHYRPVYAVNERSYWVHLDGGTRSFEIAWPAPAGDAAR